YGRCPGPRRADADGGMDGMKGKRVRAEATARRPSPMAWGGSQPAPLAKAKERLKPEASATRPLARAELLEKPARARFEERLDAAVGGKPTGEAKLAGAVRAVAPFSPALRASLGEATSVLLKRGSRQRELYACGLRALSEAQDRQSVSLLRQALAGDEAGGS